MAIVLLNAAGAGVTGDWVDVHPCAGKFTDMRVSAVGTFTGDVVTIQHAYAGFLTNPITLGTISEETDLIIDEPVEYIRAVTGGSLSGAATVLATSSL